MGIRDWLTPRKTGRYDGPVCFRANGFHYPCDQDGQPLLKQALVWVNDTPDDPDSAVGHYEWATPISPNHFHAHGLNPVEIEPL